MNKSETQVHLSTLMDLMKLNQLHGFGTPNKDDVFGNEI